MAPNESKDWKKNDRRKVLFDALALPIGDYCFDYCFLKMDKKDKYPEDEKKSKCLVPFSPNTPRTKSNVFYTPPYSAEGSSTENAPRRIPCFRREGTIPFDLSVEADELFEEYRQDILRKLKDKSMVHTVCRMIFKYLDDLSLCRWVQFCTVRFPRPKPPPPRPSHRSTFCNGLNFMSSHWGCPHWHRLILWTGHHFSQGSFDQRMMFRKYFCFLQGSWIVYFINFVVILFLSRCRASHVSKTWRKMIRKEEKYASERVTRFLAKKQGYCERKGKVKNVDIKMLLFFSQIAAS